MQTLAFYNAIANEGELIKPRFLRAVREFDKDIEVFDKEVIEKKICSDETLNQIQEILKKHRCSRNMVKDCIPRIFQWLEKQEQPELNIG